MKKIKRWVAVIMVCLLTLTGAEAVHAQTYSWMQTAKKVRVNTVVKGVAKNNQTPTLMDPWDSYEEFYYINIPTKMNISITVSVKGTQTLEVMLYNNQGNYLRQSGPWTYNRSRNQSSSTLQRSCGAGEYYIRLTHVFNYNSERYPYSMKVQGKFTNSVRINQVRKVSSTKAKITWKSAGKVTGYEIFRKNSGGAYKKIATVSGKKLSYINQRLKRRKTYYYIICAYRVVDGVKVYCQNSVAKKIRM